MSFPLESQGNDRFYNNADSFAMVFDQTWKSYSAKNDKNPPSKEEKLKFILTKIKDHPFLQASPDQAKEIAQFRLRLLNLE